MSRSVLSLTTVLAGPALTWLVQSTVLLILGLLAGRLLRRFGPAVQSAAYRTTLAAVLVCPIASALLAAAGHEGLAIRFPQPSLPPEPSLQASPGEAGSVRRSGEPSPAIEPETPVTTPTPLADLQDPARRPTSPPLLETSSPPIPITVLIPAVALPLWLLGSTMLAIRLLVGQRRMARLRAAAVPAGADAESLCRELAGLLAVSMPMVLRSPFLPSPCLDGLRRPAILLPEEDDAGLRETFAHELAHLSRRDGLWNLLRRGAVAAGWVQPLLGILSRRIEVAAEEVCDDVVVHLGADRAHYAGHLLDLAGRTLPPVAPAAVGMISVRSMLSRRVVRILDDRRSLSVRVGTLAIAGMLTIGLCGTLLAGMLGVGGRGDAKVMTQDELPLAISGTSGDPITGRIVDLEGRPVAGVAIEAGYFYTPKTGDLSPWLDAVGKGEPPWIAIRHLDSQKEPPETAMRKTVTDADGRFRLDGMGAERVVELTILGDTIAATKLEVATRAMNPLLAPGFANQHGPGIQSIYGTGFTYAAAPGRPIEGVITDKATAKPLAGVGVRSESFAGSSYGGIMTTTTTTDDRGRYRLIGMPRGRGNRLLIVPADDQPYLMQVANVPEPAGTGPVTIDLALPRGTWIDGAITEKETGKPVTGARLYYMPFLDNRFAAEHPSFHEGGGADNADIQARYLSRADGTFRLVGLPGRAIVGVEVVDGPYRQGAGAESISGLDGRGHFATYHSPIYPGKLFPTAMREINPPAGEETVHVDLQVERGGSVRLSLVDSDGKSLTAVSTVGLLGRSSKDREATTSAEIRVVHLGPGEERHVILRHPGRKLGKVLRIREGDDAKGPLVVRLEALARLTGWVAGPGGANAPGAMVRADVLPAGDFSASLPQVVTDEDGRFVVPDVPVGCDYSMAAESNGAGRKIRLGFLKRVSVRSGETTDVGEILFGASNDPAPSPRSEKPAQAKPAASASGIASIPITGRIVDLEGRPLAGASIEAGEVNVPRSGSLTAWLDGVKKGQAPWIAYEQMDWKARESAEGKKTVTDADGRFRLEGLNAERVVELAIRGETIATTKIEVATRSMDPLPAPGFPNQYGAGSMTIYGADFVYASMPSRPVVGVITDKATGKPLAGVGVRSDRFAGSDFVGTMAERTETDAGGRFRLGGMPRGKGNKIVIVPSDDQPYLVQTPEVPDAPGAEPAFVELALPAGVWIEGTVTEKATGKPVAGAWLHYLPFLENRFAQTHPSFHSVGNTENAHIQDRYLTKADGSFRLVGLPGRAIVGAVVHGGAYLQGAGSQSIPGLSKHGHFETYGSPVPAGKLFPTVMKEINPPAEARSVRVELQVETGPSVRLRVVDAEGKPVTGGIALGRTSRGSHDSDAATSSEISVENLIPGEERTVLIRHRDRKIGKALRVREKDDATGPVVVTLEPLARMTGVVMDPEGTPVQGARVRTDPLPGGSFSLSLSQVATDEQGRFVVPDVPVGCEYSMAVESSGSLAKMRVTFVKKAIVRPGETTDVGEIRFGKD